jgi:hypothetical protein
LTTSRQAPPTPKPTTKDLKEAIRLVRSGKSKMSNAFSRDSEIDANEGYDDLLGALEILDALAASQEQGQDALRNKLREDYLRLAKYYRKDVQIGFPEDVLELIEGSSTIKELVGDSAESKE